MSRLRRPQGLGSCTRSAAQLGKHEKALAGRPGGEHRDLDVVGADEMLSFVHHDHVAVGKVADSLVCLAPRPHEVDEKRSPGT